jgi:hypothetical protein
MRKNQSVFGRSITTAIMIVEATETEDVEKDFLQKEQVTGHEVSGRLRIDILSPSLMTFNQAHHAPLWKHLTFAVSFTAIGQSHNDGDVVSM